MLTVPNKANKNFPYHVRTTQIDVMEVTDGTMGNNSLDHFGHHLYAPGGAPLGRSYATPPYGHTGVAEGQVEAVFKYAGAASDGNINRDCLIIRPEEVYAVPDFTAPSQRNNIYLPT